MNRTDVAAWQDLHDAYYRDGKEIEFQGLTKGWRTLDLPTWSGDIDNYRIKATPLEGYIIVGRMTGEITSLYPTEKTALDSMLPSSEGKQVIHVREVMDV